MGQTCTGGMALQPIFSLVADVCLIHDDFIIVAETRDEHNKSLKSVLEALSNAGLTLNPGKYFHGVKELKFWGMIFSADVVCPDPEMKFSISLKNVLKNYTSPRIAAQKHSLHLKQYAPRDI